MSASKPIDHEALRKKYLQERDKRLRPEGNGQYLEPTGRYAHFLDDPFTKRVERAPLKDEVTVAIIGGGFAGLLAGARLRDAGIDRIRIIESGGDVGGVWYWNRYPGAMCDTTSLVYLPLLEETQYMPKTKYSMGPEIYGHCRRIAQHYKLYDDALFATVVTELRWDEGRARWRIRTDRGDEFYAQFVTVGTGPLARLKLPGVPGIESFAGHAFHTSRWDYSYTGGTPDGEPMKKLADKRVGIIGTGATSVQCVPPLARDAKELYVFERTPSSVDVRSNQPIDPEWYRQLPTGWQEKWIQNFTSIMSMRVLVDEDLVNDGWTDLAKRVSRRFMELMN